MDIKKITCIDNLSGNYFVDTWGNLYKEKCCELKRLKLYYNKENGYVYKTFPLINGSSKTYRFHRIVALTFITNDDPLNKIFVNHIDGDTTNNCVDNLEWVTPSENNKHAQLIGLSKNRKKCEPLSLDIYNIDTNELMYHNVSEIEASRLLNCERKSISHARKYRHGCLPKLRVRVKRCDIKIVME